MCINHGRIHTRSAEEAREKAMKVAKTTQGVITPSVPTSSFNSSKTSDTIVPMSMKAPSSQFNVPRRPIVPPIPRNEEGIRIGGCDF